jgi:Flp pilus assembly protein TadG
MIGRVSAPARFSRLFAQRRWEGGSAIVCASLTPLVVLGLAVATDYANVSHFRSRVQTAADAASLAAAETAALHPESKPDSLADQSAAAIFVRKAPHGAGTPTIAVKSDPAAVTATVGYAGLAPSNFGMALGYDAISVDASSTSLTRLADSRPTTAR